jgi:hypothetical protein
MKMLRTGLAAVGATPPKRTDRARLVAAIAARDKASQDVIAAGEYLARLHGIVDRADSAAKAAADATRIANEARQRWVRDGCLQAAKEHHAQSEAATEAAQVAQRASADADAVRRELRRAQEAIESRQVDVAGAEDQITASIGVLLAEENQPRLAQLERCAAEYRELLEQAMAVSLVLAKPWGLDYRNRRNPSAEGERMVDSALERATIKSWDRHVNDRRDPQAFIDALTAPWRARIAALRVDPDA